MKKTTHPFWRFLLLLTYISASSSFVNPSPIFAMQYEPNFEYAYESVLHTVGSSSVDAPPSMTDSVSMSVYVPAPAPAPIPIIETPIEPPVSSNSVQNEAMAFFSSMGEGNQWYAVNFIMTHESGFNPYAVNPSSGACGLFQAWPCSKLMCVLSDVTCQLEWGNDYINNRYGSPAQAYAYWMSHGNY